MDFCVRDPFLTGKIPHTRPQTGPGPYGPLAPGGLGADSG